MLFLAGNPELTQYAVFYARTNTKHPGRRDVFHDSRCHEVSGLVERGSTLRPFDTPEEAFRAGFRRCLKCVHLDERLEQGPAAGARA